MQRREYLAGLAGIPFVGTLGSDVQTLGATQNHGDSHHPGPPRFMRADERLVDPLTVDYRRGGGPDGRNVLAPQIPDPQRDPDDYADDAFQWRVVERPADSDVEGFYESDAEYDYSGDNVVEFDPDAPGTYTLALDAPDGTHEQTVRVFPEPPDGAGGRPRVNPTGQYDADAGVFEIDANPATAPDSTSTAAALNMEFYVDGRDALAESALSVDGTTATVDAADVTERTRIYVVASGDRHSVSQEVTLDPQGRVESTDEPPEWVTNATMYEIFVRSFGTQAGEADFDYLADNLDYIDSLGVDVIWLTPIVAAASHREDRPGGPHGYDTINYFQTADALGSMAEFENFVDACHERDIKVCFDLVINHVDVTHRFFQDARDNRTDSTYFEWFERESSGLANNYFGWDTLMNINYQSVALREHILAVADFWSQSVDGFRCDIAYGVEHQFWKEVREVVLANDTDFFMLDETIPYQAGFAEQEFDMHFDNELHSALIEVGRGGVDASRILDAVRERHRKGVPDSQVFLQYIENHDTRRYLDVNALHAEKAAAAATYTLPGIPMVYYGAERAIADNAEPRLDEKGHFRSFMNWDEYDEEHLAFYRALGEARDSVDALQFDAALVGAYFEADTQRVVAFGRDAGDQQVVVALNFEADPREVTLRGPVGTTDLVSGADVGIDTDADTTAVEVDSVAVLETPSLSGLGTRVAGVDDETGDRMATDDGALDLTGFDLHETETDYQFRVTVDGDIDNEADYDGGFSAQQLHVYLRDPTDASGQRGAREGLGADLAEAYQYRIVGDGETGARVETPDGGVVAEGSVFASPSTHSIRVDVPKVSLPGDLDEKQLAVAMAAYDTDGPGGVAQISDEGPQVTDLLTPDGATNQAALDATGGAIPYITLGDPLSGEVVDRFTDETGDDNGPGSYTYPTAEGFEAGVLDVESVAIYDEGDRYRFDVTMVENLTNPMDGPYGFSAQHVQLYLGMPTREGPTATEGREGTNVSFADPYNYRVVVSGFEDGSVVEAADGSVATEDVRVAAYQGMDTITASVPKSALGGEFGTTSVAPLVFGYDEDAPGAVRQVAASAGEDTFGGGSDGTDPAVIDMITPDGTDQSEVLADGTNLPLVDLAAFSGEMVAEWTDATGDDNGPGSYTYPGSAEIPNGAYDIRRVELYENEAHYRFVYYVDAPVENPWSSEHGFSVHNLQVYIHDPAASDTSSAEQARDGVYATFEKPYHYRLMVNGFEIQALEDGDGSVVSQEVSAEGHPKMNAVSATVPRDAIEGDIRQTEVAPLILGHDSYGTGLVREVAAEQEQWTFGGGRGDEMDHQVIDAITPEDIPQSEALAYSADQQASIPFVAVPDESSSDSNGQSSSDGQSGPGSHSGSDDQSGSNTATTPATEPTIEPEVTTENGTQTASDDGPGFGTVTGLLGTAGGAAYAARRLLSEDEQHEE